MKRKLILIVVYHLFALPSGNAQIRFSQLSTVPLLINPANTGRFDKSFRLGGSVRREVGNQKQDFTQSTFFLDTKILKAMIPENNCFAIGLVGLSEKSISANINNTTLSTSLAYHKALDEEGLHFLGLAFQVSLARKKIEKPDFIFENQILNWANFGYSNINVFQIGDVDFTYLNVNAGLNFQGYIGKGSFFTAGISLYNILNTRKLFPWGELNVQRQSWGYSSWEIQLREGEAIMPALLIGFTADKFSNILLGGNFQKKVNKSSNAVFGLWYKNSVVNGHYLVPTLGLNFKSFSITASYDIALFPKSIGIRGANEFTMSHTITKRKYRSLTQRFMKF